MSGAGVRLDGFDIAAFVAVDQGHAAGGDRRADHSPQDQPVPQGGLGVEHGVAQLGDDVAGGVEADHAVADDPRQLLLRVVEDAGHVEQQAQDHVDDIGQVLEKDAKVEQPAAEPEGQQKQQQQEWDGPQRSAS